MSKSWAAIVLLAAAAGSLLAVERDTGDRSQGTIDRERYVLYSETDFRGEMKYAVLEKDAYEKRSAEIAKINRVLRQAYLAAAKAWAEDEAHKGTPFPMRMPQLLQCSRVATYSTREKAEEMLARRQERLDKKAEEAARAEERRLAALTDAARAKEKEKKDLLKTAEALFQAELQRLLAGSGTAKAGTTN